MNSHHSQSICDVRTWTGASVLMSLLWPLTVLAATFAWGVSAPDTCMAQSPPGPRVTFAEKPDPKKEALLKSERWRRAKLALEDWLSVQKIYDQKGVENLKMNLSVEVDRLSGDELEELLEHIEAKLKVLMSPEAEQARTWLGQYLAVRSDIKPEQLRLMLPDVKNATPAQLREELMKLEEKRSAAVQQQQTFDQGRQAQVQATMDAQRRQQESIQRSHEQAARNAAISRPASQSPYTPRIRPYQDPGLNPAYYVTPWGGVGRSLP